MKKFDLEVLDIISKAETLAKLEETETYYNQRAKEINKRTRWRREYYGCADPEKERLLRESQEEALE